MKITVLGAGAWGTALAIVAKRGGHDVTLWGYRAEQLDEMQASRCSERFLPGIELPDTLNYEPDISRAVSEAELVVVAVPSKAVRSTASMIAGYSGTVVSVTKGIEFDSGLTMCGIIGECVPGASVAALTGPTMALEVARNMPCALVAASTDEATALQVQAALHQPTFRIYTSTDLAGVEMGGALKNVIAIAAGVCDGLGFGDNSKAALVTRAIVEIRRLGTATGANAETFSGLSGLGDLMVTCFSPLGRNRGFGLRLGKGEKTDEILGSSKQVVEGYHTARSAWQLARKLGVDTPIIDEVYSMLHEGKNLKQAIHDLTSRSSKAED